MYVNGNLADVQVNSGRSHLFWVWARRADGWKVLVYQEVMSRETSAPCLAGVLSISFSLFITVRVTPENQLAEVVLRGSSVLAQDFRGPQMGWFRKLADSAQKMCVSRLIGSQQAGKSWLLLGSFIAEWIDVIRMTILSGFRLPAPPNGNCFYCLRFDTVRIG